MYSAPVDKEQREVVVDKDKVLENYTRRATEVKEDAA
jgi:hypothetical protein